MATKKRVPEIRFQGFSGEWERKTLGEIASKVGSGKTPKGGESAYVSEGIPLIRSQNIYDNAVNLEDIVFISEETNENMGNSIVAKNDVLLNITGASIGRCAVYRIGESANVNQHVCIIRPKIGCNPSYIQLKIASPEGQRSIDITQAGGGREGLNFQQIGLMSFSFPPIDEQTQIGSFFQRLDSQITLYQRKLTKLGAIKKAMLEKMFPREGAAVPEIRFQGFTDDWETKTLGEIITEVRRPIVLQDEQTYELVTVKRRNEGVVSRGLFKGKQILVKNYFELRAGDYIISKRQIVHGANGIIPLHLDRAIASNEYLVLIDNDQIVTSFFALYSKRPEMYRKFFLSSYGIDVEKLVFDVDDWKKRFLAIPKLAEQQKIASFFQSLDSLISFQKRELDKLKNLKQACLEKMFV